MHTPEFRNTKVSVQHIAIFVVAIALLSYFFASTNAQSPAAFDENIDAASGALICVDTLPDITYLGEYPGDYVLPAGYETFIVKRRNPFRFDADAGTIQNGQSFYTSSERERVWACTGECTFSAFNRAAVDLGPAVAGQSIELIVLDDDGFEQNDDQRRNWWAATDPMVQYAVVQDQQLTEYLDFTVPFDANWYFYAADSVGIVTKCIKPLPTPTPTATATVVFTQTPSAEPTPTETPTATATQPVEPTPTDAPTETPTPTNTVEPTATQTVEPTPTSPPVAGHEATVMPTPLPTVVLPPTAIELIRMNASVNGGHVVVSWETGAEIGTVGFHVWRSATGSRQAAVKLTESLMPSQGRTDTGAVYEYVDTSAQTGVHYTYWIQEVELSGAEQDVGTVHTEFLGYLYLPITVK